MEAPVTEPIKSRAWRDFFVWVSDTLGIFDPFFMGFIFNKTFGYNPVFLRWCLAAQQAVNAVTPGAISDFPVKEIAQARFGPMACQWFVKLAKEVTP